MKKYLCCLCFELKPLEDLWVDDAGVRWDVCAPCRKLEVEWEARTADAPVLEHLQR